MQWRSERGLRCVAQLSAPDKRNELIGTCVEERIVSNNKSADSLFDKGRKGRVDVAFSTGASDQNLLPYRAGRHLKVPRQGVSKNWIRWIDKQGNESRRRDQFV